MDGENIEQIDSFIAIATAYAEENQQEGDLIIIHLQKAQSEKAGDSDDFKYVSKQTHPALHELDITQIVILTDYERLQFVTCGLDRMVKILEIEADAAQSEASEYKSFSSKVTYEITASGPVFNALCLHGPTGLFALSTYDEEAGGFVQILRRKTERCSFGPYDVNVLDFILIGNNQICLPDP